MFCCLRLMQMSLVRFPSIGKHERDDLIERQTICRIAFKGSKYSYIAPFQYVTIEGTLYFYFTNYGRKMRTLDVTSDYALK